MLSDDILWTLDDCDDADLSPESKRALGLDAGDGDWDERSGVRNTRSGEVPTMTEEQARELLAGQRGRAA